jgi:5-(carboxyamino)imidazole ribonucleotide synthase
MFAGAAHRMGYPVAVWDPDPDAPAHRLARHSFPDSFADPNVLDLFGGTAQVVTFEWENVPADLCAKLERHRPVRPGSAVLRVIQDRIEQKRFLQAKGLPVPRFSVVESVDHLPSAVNEAGLPAICKTATAGYDGKGQWTLCGPSDLARVQQALAAIPRPGARWILEPRLDFERELSVLVVRGEGGDCRVYPVADNCHEAGILRLTLVPAPIPAATAEQAADVARRAVSALDGVGIFCVELFQMRNGDLLINEIAPRPHNSGHYTLDACSVSQFEQQVRAVCAQPLGEVRLLSPAAMVNLLGADIGRVTTDPGCRELLSTPGAVLHLYGKREVRPGRKMGHVTFLADRVEIAADRAAHLMKRLAE